MSVASLSNSRFTGAFKAAPVQRRVSRRSVACLAAAAPLPSVLQAIGNDKLNSKALWEKLQAEPASFKSRSYMKNIVEHAQRKNWVDVKFDGTMFVFCLTDLGRKQLEEQQA